MRVKGRKGRQFVKRTEMERQMWCDKLCATVRLFLCHVLGGGSEMEVTLGGQIACDQLRLLSGCRLVRSSRYQGRHHETIMKYLVWSSHVAKGSTALPSCLSCCRCWSRDFEPCVVVWHWWVGCALRSWILFPEDRSFLVVK